jgi:hypothetical protein
MGHGAWGMGHGAWAKQARAGHGAWGMGHGAWGMGHGAWGMGQTGPRRVWGIGKKARAGHGAWGIGKKARAGHWPAQGIPHHAIEPLYMYAIKSKLAIKICPRSH